MRMGCASSGARSQMGHSHGLVRRTTANEMQCDTCHGRITPGTSHLTCPVCDYDECDACFRVTQSFQAAHCSHCRGLTGGACACDHGCHKPASAGCHQRQLVPRPSGGGGRASGSGGGGVAIAALESNEIGLAVNLINLVIVADKSNSMHGVRWQSVLRGIQEAFNALHRADVMTVITFNDDVKTVGPSQKADFPLARVLREQPSGTTALYDAVLQGLSTGLQVHRRLMDGQQLNVMTYVVVMTDGDDCASRTSLQDVCEVLQMVNVLPGFHVVFGGVDLPADGRWALQRMAAVGNERISFTEMTRGTNNFDELFAHVTLQLTRRVLVGAVRV